MQQYHLLRFALSSVALCELRPTISSMAFYPREHCRKMFMEADKEVGRLMFELHEAKARLSFWRRQIKLTTMASLKPVAGRQDGEVIE